MEFDLNAYRSRILDVFRAQRAVLPWNNVPDDVEITMLGIGESNLMLLIEAEGQQPLTVRMAYRHDGAELSLLREFALLRQLPEDLGPQPIFLDMSRQMLPYPFAILSFIPGVTPAEWSEELLRTHATNLARMHSHEASTYTSRDREQVTAPFDLYGIFQQALVHWRVRAPWIFEDQLVQRLLPRLDAYFREHNHLFVSLTRFSLIHGDLCASNILVHEDKVRYIDWEYARYGDGALDFAQLAWEIDNPPWQVRLTESQLTAFFQAYLEQRLDQTLIERYKVWCTYIQFFDHVTHRQTARYPKALQAFTSEDYQAIYKRMLNSLARQFL